MDDCLRLEYDIKVLLTLLREKSDLALTVFVSSFAVTGLALTENVNSKSCTLKYDL